MKTLIAIVYLLLCSSLLIAQDLAHISKPKPIQLRSGFSLQSNWYQVNGISPRQPGFSWFLSGTPVLEVYGMAVPFQFTLSNHHQRIQQPFNQFGINPQYKWAKLHLGYSSMRFSPFTLSNYRFFGLGTSLNPGKLRFGALYGRFQKAVSKTNSLTGLEGEYFNTHAIPAFERKAFGIKLGIGSERNYVDLIFLKGKDEPTSAEIEETPTENAVVGLSCQLTFFKKLIWKTDLAASAFTRDQFSDSLAMGTFSGQSLVSKIILPRATSQILTAGETSLNFRGKYLQLGLKYRRVDPDYKSMGAYYFQTDVEQWLFSPSFSSKNRKWFLSGSIGRERNNLYQQRPVTTTRLIGSANLNWNASRNFGLNAQYSNFGISQNPLASNLSDTTLLEQIAQNFSLVPRVNWQGHGSSHSLSWILSYNALADFSESILYQADLKTWMNSLNYNLSLSQNHWSFQTNLFYRSLSTQNGLIKSQGLGLGIQKMLADKKLQIQARGHYYRNHLEDDNAGYTYRLMLESTYRFRSGLRVYLRWQHLRNISPGNSFSQDFTEQIGTSGLQFQF